ncbi:MAG: hypothetical protein EPO16_08650 [Dehalococcoidia bacterium]|nr:MAG: hypothetical protein EPO16_08650 [Dehalococcoidia bacterium]
MTQPSDTTRAYEAFDALPLDALEEACGEFHRRIAVALRAIGEYQADEGGREAPRRLVAGYAASLELACATFAAAAAGIPAPGGRSDRHPAAVAAVMYGAPTIPVLLARLEQDRRMLASLARHEEARLSGVVLGPWGEVRLRRVLTEVALGEASRCAQVLESRVAAIEAEERARMERERGESGLV